MHFLPCIDDLVLSRPTKQVKSQTLFWRVMGIHTSWIILNIVNRCQRRRDLAAHCVKYRWQDDDITRGMSIIWREINLSCSHGIGSWPKETGTKNNHILPLFRLFAEEEAAEAALYWIWLFARVETFTYSHPVKKILENDKYWNIHSRPNLPLPIAMPYLRLVACTLTKFRLFSHRYLVM